jgi:hypothetical protein
MKTKIATLPNWTFNINEVSSGVYKLSGQHKLGCNIELTGVDPEKLIEEAKTSAEKMEQDIKKK